MYSIKENFLRTIKGDNPDRIVVQWEALNPIMTDPCNTFARGNRKRGTNSVDRWGTHISWPEDQPAAMPHITEETKVLKDITNWRDYVNVPDVEANASEGWEDVQKQADEIRANGGLVMAFMGTGMFEQMHYLMGFEDTLVNLLVEPEASHELLDVICEYRCTYAQLIIDNLKPDYILSHDDWGSKANLFMHPDVWREFFKERYAKFYKLFRDAGITVIHHADSHCESIVEDMVDIGVDIWQGVLPQNDIPKIQKQLNGRMALMGGIDAAIVDIEDVDEEIIRAEVRRACDEYVPAGYFIPCLPNGLRNGAIFPRTDEIIDDEIAKYSKNIFK